MRSFNFVKRFVKSPHYGRRTQYIAVGHEYLLPLMAEPKNESNIARDADVEQHGGSEARRQPHKGFHNHVCGGCGIVWSHEPEQCYLRSFARCVNCLREGKNATPSIN